jgi:hypothetical protein
VGHREIQRRFRIARLALASLLPLWVGCASFRPLDLSQGLPTLEPGEGILVLHIMTDVPLHTVETMSTVVARDLAVGEHLLLFAASPGTYRFTGITRMLHGVEHSYTMSLADPSTAFSVEAGRINYPRMLIVWKPEVIHWRGMTLRDHFYLGLRSCSRTRRATGPCRSGTASTSAT